MDDEELKEYKTPPEYREGMKAYKAQRKLKDSKPRREDNALNQMFNMPDGNPTMTNYQTTRFDALCMMLYTQPNKHEVPYTKEQIDVHPSTKDLPEEEKKILVKYWPKWKRDQTKAYEVIELRKKEVELATQASKDVEKLREVHGLEQLPLAARLNKAAICMTQQLLNAAEHLAVTSHDQVFTDDLSQAMFKSRLLYTKEYMGIARALADMATRIEESESLSAEDGKLSQDAIDQLNRANEMLRKKGVVSYVDADVKILPRD